jgi:putative transposase
LDEVFVKVNGKLCYLWRAVDHEGEVLEAVVTARRDKGAALKLLVRLLKKYGSPRSIVTDGLRVLGCDGRDSVLPRTGMRSAAASTIGPRIRTSHFDDESGRCCGSEA